MKAQIINKFGPLSVFEYIDIDKSEIKLGHVFIKAHSTSVNQIDCKICWDTVNAIAPNFPTVLHDNDTDIIADGGKLKPLIDSHRFTLNKVPMHMNF